MCAQVRAKEKRAQQVEALQRRSQEKCGLLQADIQVIKQQKARGEPRSARGRRRPRPLL